MLQQRMTYRVKRLSTGRSVHYVDRNELDFLYHEIYARKGYAHELIDYRDGSVVFDGGANIGLFSLYVAERCRHPRLVAFEPIPEIATALARNLAVLEAETDAVATVFQCGLSDRSREAVEFCYWPRSPGRSGIASKNTLLSTSDEERAREKGFIEGCMDRHPNPVVARAFSRMPTRVRSWLSSAALGYVKHKRRQRFCRVRTLSDCLDELGEATPRIDLLKIDTEGGEIEILNGIREEHWPHIRQLVLELDGNLRATGALAVLIESLHVRGFRTATAPNVLSPLCVMLFASRPSP